MKHHIVAVPNPINDALDAVERLGRLRLLEVASCELLKLLYLWGWNDGFVPFKPGASREALAFDEDELCRALGELEELGFIRLRAPVQGYAPIEILSLSAGELADCADLTWWRYYNVALLDETDEH
jgi:hypothetical protein